MPNPSLLIVPARFKTGRLYSQIPSNTDNRGDFTVTRATTATRVGPDGLIESVASGIPRLDYFASGGVVGCPALLVEPSAQNVFERSEEFNDAYWSNSRMNAFGSGSVANTTTAPDGTMTADYIQQQTGQTLAGGVFRAISVTSGTIYTLAVFAKQSDARYLRLGFAIGAGGAGLFCGFDLQDGIAGTPATGITPTINNFGNGWFRCSISATSLVTTSANQFIYIGNSLNATSGTPDTGIFIWGAQVETGSVATSYIPTTTAAVTRNADTISVTGAVSGSIGQTEGTIYCEYIPVASGPAGASFFTNIITSARNINTNTGFSITHRQSDNTIKAEFFIGDGTLGSITLLSGTVAFGNVVKVAFAYKTGDFALAINGNVVQTTSVSFTSVTTINTIELTNPNIYFGYPGTVRHRAAALYTTRLTNAELAALTA